MACQKCSSNRVMTFNGKCSDLFMASMYDSEADEVHEEEGYVIRGVNIGGGDYISASVCLDCGQLQGQWPVGPVEELGEAEE